jgi:hypothetical protein
MCGRPLSHCRLLLLRCRLRRERGTSALHDGVVRWRHVQLRGKALVDVHGLGSLRESWMLMVHWLLVVCR